MNPSNLCRHLRNKSMFIPALAEDPPADPEASERSGHCWCNRTLTETGPDDRPVGTRTCSPARSCFED